MCGGEIKKMKIKNPLYEATITLTKDNSGVELRCQRTICMSEIIDVSTLLELQRMLQAPELVVYPVYDEEEEEEEQ